jgi:glycine/D-amino acid oxidase-like deaminating enzyme
LTREARCDVLVIGGGVCGLWTLHALRAAGYDAWLIEKSALGDGQTIASQGILHAGAKYRLPGNAIDAAEAVAEMQSVWEDALRDRDGIPGLPRLSGTRVIDEWTLLWTMPSLGSRVAAAGASRVMRSKVVRLDRERWPAGFGGGPRGVDVFETSELVLDPASLLERLRAGVRDRVRRGEVVGIGVRGDGVVVEVRRVGGDGRDARPAGDGGKIAVRCGAVVLAAGEGNEALIGLAGGKPGLMQRRPLHQIVAIGAPFDLNGHCLQLSLDKPALTVTTGELEGERTWYLGGGPAEEGVGRSRGAQLEAGRAALARCLPWVDTSGMSWRTFEIDRAEGWTKGGKRPDDAVAAWAAERALAVWPTKLVLAPRAAGLVLERLRERGIEASGAMNDPTLSSLPEPGVARRVW